ncbi:MAG: protein rep [Clostridia bacterium]|nr:protein rep [Clostridia bacterium]
MRYNSFRKLHKANSELVIPAFKKAATVCDNQVDLLREAYKIADCGEAINAVRCNDCGTNHFKSFVRCKSKFCLLCQRVKSALWTMHLYSWLKQWLEQGNYVVFLNLTIKDTDLLKDGLNQLEGAWRQMTGKNFRKAFLSKFPGGFRSIEVKTGKNSGQWHPHIHALVLKERFSKDTDFLHYVWPRCVAENGGYAENLKIMAFKRQPNEPDEEYNLRLIKSVKEVCKYITKFDWEKETPERIGEMYSALKGKRQYAVWGVLSYVRQEVENDLTNKSNKEVEDFICQKCGCTRGTPNKMYKEIWGSADEPIIMDYKTSMPETLVDKEELNRLKAVNMSLAIKQQVKRREWVQEQLDLGLIEYKHPD